MNRKEKTQRLAICAMLSALGVVLLYLGSLEIMDISMAVLASLCCVYAVIEFGGWAPWQIFFVTGILSMILRPGSSAAVMYLLFFGFYPILKEKFEKKPKAVAWILKELTFNVALVLIFLALRFVLSQPDLIALSPVFIAVLAIMAEAVFILYDIALTRLITFYLFRLRDRFRFKR